MRVLSSRFGNEHVRLKLNEAEQTSASDLQSPDEDASSVSKPRKRMRVYMCQRRTEAGTNNRCLRILVFYYRRRKDNPINTHRYKFIIAIIIATTRHITSTAYYTYPPGVTLAM